jgi:hypothetical protein
MTVERMMKAETAHRVDNDLVRPVKADCPKPVVESTLSTSANMVRSLPGMVLHDSEDVLQPVELRSTQPPAAAAT